MRTVEVEQFCSWSACRMSSWLSAFSRTGEISYSSLGTANIMWRKFAQYARFAVEVRDRARRRARVHVPAIERDVSGVVAERPDVDRVLVLGPDDDRKRGFLAVGEGQFRGELLVGGHNISLGPRT